jgi:hypothetical protein
VNAADVAGLFHAGVRNSFVILKTTGQFILSRPLDFSACKTLFTMRVDRKFTVDAALLFTKPFDRPRRYNLAACLSHRCNAG